MKKRVLGMLLTGLVVGGSAAYVVHANPSVTGGSSVSAATYSKEFTDIAADFWAASQIADARGQGYIDGYADGSFQPNRKVSRAEFVKMAVVALHINVDSAGSDPWYKAYMDAAKKAGIYADGDFSDDDLNAPMTRLEMAKIAVRASGQNTSDSNKWMYLATKSGLIQGVDETGELGVDENTNRAQSVMVISRTQKIKGGEIIPLEKSAKRAMSRAEVLWHGTNIFTMWPRYVSGQDADQFSVAKAKWDSPDGIYHEQLVEFIVVDMGDKLDPFKDETEGMKFNLDKFDSTGMQSDSQSVSIPQNSYVAFSKVKQTLTGSYPQGWYASEGGRVTVRNIGPSNNGKEWKVNYSSQETPDNILFTKMQTPQNVIDINVKRGNNPYDPTYLKPNVDYFWVTATMHPKGDMFIDTTNMHIGYVPNVYYYNHGGGKPSSANMNTNLLISAPDYKVHNQ
ncbi:hypothetical protein GCM10008018_72850 [Paenibacillus marchantiophytorum]|uniref:SLH domain-containing protein n=1 Tax=Paenibacillus marchantiophytorum TaxID=1619310 RepID=A0ABQ1FKM6_9BACL|nr:S-layer homology domain-containing protein [Paenibacillus marchantiophytorum]GGA18348.1 hypothetical protein GCM10008018_72850 [Paenibacillus marchantiophytorum]